MKAGRSGFVMVAFMLFACGGSNGTKVATRLDASPNTGGKDSGAVDSMSDVSGDSRGSVGAVFTGGMVTTGGVLGTGGLAGAGGSLGMGGAIAVGGMVATGGSAGPDGGSPSDVPQRFDGLDSGRDMAGTDGAGDAQIVTGTEVVTFANGKAQGFMNGYGWVGRGAQAILTSPTCDGKPMSSQAWSPDFITLPMVGPTCSPSLVLWSRPDALCLSGEIPPCLRRHWWRIIKPIGA